MLRPALQIVTCFRLRHLLRNQSYSPIPFETQVTREATGVKTSIQPSSKTTSHLRSAPDRTLWHRHYSKRLELLGRATTIFRNPLRSTITIMGNTTPPIRSINLSPLKCLPFQTRRHLVICQKGRTTGFPHIPSAVSIPPTLILHHLVRHLRLATEIANRGAEKKVPIYCFILLRPHRRPIQASHPEYSLLRLHLPTQACRHKC